MKKFIRTNWKEVVIAVFMIFVSYELNQIRSELSYIEGDVSSIQLDVNSIESRINY